MKTTLISHFRKKERKKLHNYIFYEYFILILVSIYRNIVSIYKNIITLLMTFLQIFISSNYLYGTPALLGKACLIASVRQTGASHRAPLPVTVV